MRKIAQPYCVWWDFSQSDVSINRWCSENLTGYYYFLPVGGHRILSVKDIDETHEEVIDKETLLCMFECPKDALMFKLTWVGQ